MAVIQYFGILLAISCCLAKPQSLKTEQGGNQIVDDELKKDEDSDLLGTVFVEEVAKTNLVNPFDDGLDNETRELLKDPCYAVDCQAGKMCVVKNAETRETECICPTTCPDDDSPVCSVYGKEYKNYCTLHKEACALGQNIRVAYEGNCFAKQRECNETEITQFPIRFLDWMMHLRQEEKTGESDPNTSLLDLSRRERHTVAQWMFEKLDLERDMVLQDYDLNDMLLYLLPVEHCIDEFLKVCDQDSSKSISLREWKICLMPGSNSADNNYFDEI